MHVVDFEPALRRELVEGHAHRRRQARRTGARKNSAPSAILAAFGDDDGDWGEGCAPGEMACAEISGGAGHARVRLVPALASFPAAPGRLV